jgi:gamma-glutamyl-gamma-aminobutyrate hydrolase PuuD
MKVKPQRTVGVAPEGHYGQGVGPFGPLFSHKKFLSDEESFKGIDCMILWGGTDINPSFYNEKHSNYSGASPFISARDEFEWKALLYCKKHDIPTIGICRGAQLGCAFAGGSLIQHVTGHGGCEHLICTHDGRTVYTNSVHHQMMNPYKIPHTLLAWASPARSKMYINGDDEEVEMMRSQQEPEIVYFPEIRMLGIQGHPEYGSAPRAFQDLCLEYAAEYLFGEKLVEV